jgi:thymidylate synthase (FAD)
VVNAARASFEKEEDTLTEKGINLLTYLAKNKHESPFRHCALTFEIKAPLFVARQMWRYVVASCHTEDMFAWSEASRRYVTSEPDFYIPNKNEWRGTPENKKQGSSGNVPTLVGVKYTDLLEDSILQGVKLYESAMKNGICAEQARLFLPAYSMYVTWRWTSSLQAVVHFLNQRLDQHAQYEIQLYAKAIQPLVEARFPYSYKALMG